MVFIPKVGIFIGKTVSISDLDFGFRVSGIWYQGLDLSRI